MPIPPYISDAAQAKVALDLVSRLGREAGVEAALQAARCRDVGNHVHFCRWRQVERLVRVLVAGRAVGTLQ